ncbi:uncharacterized protein LOC129764328 [Toxorhynchites rutilus septentrionalis]|uniref:uncharacterized protein LOC129764328 n=1 Tax=Toxorhynchites rutilus septentrionalis TaxID=329112 RepID=UPI00247A7FDD|nr:uncharacterized protein LOC129764328 [Toxorhynchites rutilus septentrionalis]
MLPVKVCGFCSLALITVSFLTMDHFASGFKHISPWSDEKKSVCSSNNHKLLSLFNLLCNTTQTTSVTSRDACYGCFFRAGALPAGQTQLMAISQCATMYLMNTSYALCAASLAAIVTGMRPTTAPSPTTNCYTGYCEFVQCIRRGNANSLINQCILQTLPNRDLNVEAQRVGFYLNATSCILARVRCDAYNPITGELQTPLGPSSPTHGVRNTDPLANSLQISPAGDIRVISFPTKIMVADLFCTARATLDQSTFGNSVC